MNIKDCIEFINGNALCYYETFEDDQPRIRAMNSWFTDESGFYFQTGDINSVYEQFQKNPKTEICFYKQEKVTGSILRISGEVEFISDKKILADLLNSKKFIKSFGKVSESADLIAFRISHGTANFWTMENNIKPKESFNF